MLRIKFLPAILLFIMLSGISQCIAASYTRVIGVAPSRGEENVSVNKIIAITFNNDIREETVNVSSLTVIDDRGNSVDGYIFYEKESRRVFFKPKELLKYNTEYTVILTAYLVLDTANNPLIDDVISTFRTADEVNTKYLISGDKTQPEITKLFPGSETQDVPVDSSIFITFSENIKPSTLNPYTVILEDELGAITGKFFYSEKYFKLKFQPIEKLKKDTRYKVTITDGITDLSGNFLKNPLSYVFFTEKPEDTEPPFVVNTSPVADAEGVRISSNIMVTFSEAIDVKTLTPNTIYLMEGNEKAAARIDYDANLHKVLISPESSLKYGVNYQLYITNKVTDLRGNGFRDIYVLRFTMEPAPDSEPPAIVAVYPEGGAKNVKINAKAVVTFSEDLIQMTVNHFTAFLSDDSGNVASVISFGAGDRKIIITPSANLSYGTRYKIHLKPGIKDKAGNSLINEEIYQFETEPAPDREGPVITGSEPEDHASNVPVKPRFTVDFNEPVNSKTIDESSVRLLDRDGKVVPCTYNAYEKTLTSLIIIPNKELEHEQEYTLVLEKSIEDENGNQMEQLHKIIFYTAARPDTVSPAVVYISPENNAENVEITAQLGAAFSEDMQIVTINEFSVVLSDGKNNVSGKVSYDKLTRKVMFVPDAMLEFSKTYVMTIKNTVRDIAGNQMEKDVMWRFTMENKPDREPPRIVYVSPKDKTENVPVDETVVLKFSEPVLEISINEFNVILHADSKHVAGLLKYDRDKSTVTFTPDKPLEYSTKYTLTVSKQIIDLAENKMSDGFSITFETAPKPDTERPVVSAVEPSQNAENVSVMPTIKLMFSEPMKEITLNKFTVNLKNAQDETVDYDMGVTKSQEIILTPKGKLDYDSTYRIVVSRMVQDLAGNCPLSTFISAFHTQRKPDGTPPKVVNVTPADQASGVDVGSKIIVKFSEPLKDTSVNSSTIMLQQAGSSKLVASTVNLGKLLDTVELVPQSRLEYETSYRIIVSASVKDIAGNELEKMFAADFTTSPMPDTVVPRVISMNPVDLETNVPVDAKVVVKFSEAIDLKSISEKTVSMSVDFTQVPLITSFSEKTNTLILIPRETLSYLTKYRVIIGGKITDKSGNELGRAVVISFTTSEPPDTVKPRVITYVPKNEEVVKPENVKIRIQFSERMQEKTINQYTFMVYDKNKNFVPGVIKYDETAFEAEFIPASEIPYGEKYTVSITEGILDTAGNPLREPIKYAFSIGREVDNVKPQVVMTVPSTNEKDVSITSPIIATFSKRMSMKTLNKYTMIVSDGTRVMEGRIDYNDRLRQVVFTPDDPLKTGKLYQVTLTDGITDINGNPLEETRTWMFKTVSYR